MFSSTDGHNISKKNNSSIFKVLHGKQKQHHFLSKKGFSIIEVLFGVTIFTVGMLGIAALQISTIKGNSFSGTLSEASLLGSSKLETLMGRAYTHADLLDNNAPFGTAGLDSTGAAADNSDPGVGRNGVYTVQWNIADNQPSTNCKMIKVIVSWSVKGNNRSVSISGVRWGGIN
jgi:Tfp pilus assembly protein PilV